MEKIEEVKFNTNRDDILFTCTGLLIRNNNFLEGLKSLGCSPNEYKDKWDNFFESYSGEIERYY